MTIRPAIPDDIPRIAAIWNAEIRNGTATFTTEEKSEADLLQRIRGADPLLALTDGGQLTGFACAGDFRAGPGYAHSKEITIYLDPAHHGKGQGRTLITALELELKALGTHLMVAAISGTNTGALAFHKAVGFNPGGILPQAGRKHGNWLDLHLLFKHL